MLKDEYRKVIDQYMGIHPTEEQMDDLMDALFDLGLNIDNASEVREYIESVFNGPTREQKERAEREAKELAEKLAAQKEHEAEMARQAALKAEQQRLREKAIREKEAADAAARKQVTYTVTITGVTEQMKAQMTLRASFGWGFSESKQKLSTIPVIVCQGTDQLEAVELNDRLNNGGMTCMISATNGLGESVDCSTINQQAQVKAYQSQQQKNKEREQRQMVEKQQQSSGIQDKDTYNVILTDAGAAKLQVIMAVKDSCKVSLKEAKELVDGCPSVLKEGTSSFTANIIKRKIESAGAIVVLK